MAIIKKIGTQYTFLFPVKPNKIKGLQGCTPFYYPIWWGGAAWPTNDFVKSNDFTGKTVIPFCTSGSSGIGSSGTALAAMAGTGNWLSGQRFSGSVSETQISQWISGMAK